MKKGAKGLRSLRERFQKMKPRNKYILSSVIFLAVFALILTWLLEYRYFSSDMFRTWSFVIGSRRVFLFNSFLMYLILLALWALLGRPSFVACISSILVTILGYAHMNKMRTRAYPLLPEDFALAEQTGSLSKFVSIESIINLILALVIIVVLTIIFNKKLEKRLFLRPAVKEKSFMQRHFVTFRVCLAVMACSVFMVSTEFARHNSGERYEDIWFLGTHFTAWNQNRNYDDNGFILAFLYNLQKLEIAEPTEYSKDFIANISEKYTKKAEEENKNRSSAKEEKLNVVVILNESFYDPNVSWGGRKFTDYYNIEGGEVLPTLRKIQEKYPHGYMYTTDYGGGTANIEFETLTGFSNYWLNTVPYTAIIPKLKSVPSIATMLSAEDYSPVAIHAYNGGMYKRNISLKKEGFNSFITDIEMDYTERDGGSEYINDRSSYNQTIKQIKESDDEQMIALITMQNHTPYNPWNYEETKYKVTNSDLTDQEKSDIEIYLQSIHQSDKYLGEFLSELEKLDEKVAILYFGDHAPGLFDKINDNEDYRVRDLSRLTPYFVWTNYETNYEKFHLPTTTPNCTANTFLNTLNLQKNARYYFLDTVCAEHPILAQSYYDDREFVETETLKKYRLLIYDIMGGSRYWKE